MGRTECNRVVNFPGNPRLTGQMVDVTVTEALPHSLRGEVCVTLSGNLDYSRLNYSGQSAYLSEGDVIVF